jgi:hypothetical protein
MSMFHVQSRRSSVLVLASACLTATASSFLSCAPAEPETSPTLFASTAWLNNVVSFAEAPTLNGDTAPTSNLTGDKTGLGSPLGIAVDGAGNLIVANGSANSITFYRNAAATNGNIPPDRTLQGTHTGLGDNNTDGPIAVAIDRANDTLYVITGSLAAPVVLVFAHASTIDGDTAPTRLIHDTNLTHPRSLCLDQLGNLYVANDVANTPSIIVFPGIANPGTIPSPIHMIQASPAFGSTLVDLCVDSENRLYVLHASGTRIDVFENAASLHGLFPPHATLLPPMTDTTGAPSCIAVDSHGRGYIGAGGSIYCCENIASLNGQLVATRTITGLSTQLALVLDVFIAE